MIRYNFCVGNAQFMFDAQDKGTGSVLYQTIFDFNESLSESMKRGTIEKIMIVKDGKDHSVFNNPKDYKGENVIHYILEMYIAFTLENERKSLPESQRVILTTN